MRKLTDRLWEFKEKLTTLLQPITEAELYLFLHTERRVQPAPSIGSTYFSTNELSAHEKELVRLVLT